MQLKIEHLSFTYDGAPEAVFADLSLSLDTAWRTGLIARNGRGKTTLLRLLSGDLQGKGKIDCPLTPVLFPYPVADGTQIASSRGDDAAPTISSTDDGYLYLASIDTTQTVYTYTYTDANGTVQTIGTSTGDSTNFTAATLYSRSTTDSGITRLEALKNAAATFANSVEEKAKGADGVLGTEDDISHRIAVVGFAVASLLFFNTLFDENAACHIAFGAGYPTNIKGGSAMTRAQLMEKGLNDSAIHEDVMIGAPDTHITGTTKDGQEVTIFVNGEWAF